VPYFHVVFTVPDEIATIAFHNQVVVYDILFRGKRSWNPLVLSLPVRCLDARRH
jgi:hypothetical protein